MDSVGSEVGQKMRSAIRAKLTELDCYVDDELPDYIMVMVANKRSKGQMNDDLKLFLKAQTDVFVDWLHIVLKKLKEVTVAPKESSKKPKKRRAELAKHVKKERSLTDDLPININRKASIKDEFDFEFIKKKELKELENQIKNVKSRLGSFVHSDDEGSPPKGRRDDAVGSPRSTTPPLPPSMERKRITFAAEGDGNTPPRKKPRMASKVSKVKERTPERDGGEVRVREVRSQVNVKPRSFGKNVEINKNLILKAVAEAQRSVAQTKKESSALFTKRYLATKAAAAAPPDMRRKVREILSSTIDGPTEKYVPQSVTNRCEADTNYVPTAAPKSPEKTVGRISPIVFDIKEGARPLEPIVPAAIAAAKPKPGVCLYYPKCKNGDRCEYLHETVCRFGDNCTKKDCRFKHSAKAGEFPATRMCKFGKFCRNAACKFGHTSLTRKH